MQFLTPRIKQPWTLQRVITEGRTFAKIALLALALGALAVEARLEWKTGIWYPSPPADYLSLLWIPMPGEANLKAVLEAQAEQSLQGMKAIESWGLVFDLRVSLWSAGFSNTGHAGLVWLMPGNPKWIFSRGSPAYSVLSRRAGACVALAWHAQQEVSQYVLDKAIPPKDCLGS